MMLEAVFKAAFESSVYWDEDTAALTVLKPLSQRGTDNYMGGGVTIIDLYGFVERFCHEEGAVAHRSREGLASNREGDSEKYKSLKKS